MRSEPRPTTWACPSAGPARSWPTWPGTGSPGWPRSAWARPTRPAPRSTPPPGHRSNPAWPRTGASRSCWEADMADDDDKIFDAEIVNEENGELAPLVPPDTILTPCHHGCSCGLHQQVVYGERVPLHSAAELDHGEMALLVEAAGDATQMLSGFHDHFRQLRATTTQSHSQACRALHELTTLLRSDVVGKASAARERVETEYADLTPAERQPAPPWLKVAAVAAVVGMCI